MDGSNINFTSPAALLVGSDLELIESVPASGNFDTIQILTDGLYVVQIQADLDQIATTDGTVDIELNNNGDGTTAPLLSFADNDVRYPLRPTAGTTTVELRNAFAPVFLAGRCKPGVQLNVGVKSNLKAGTLVGHAVDIIVQCQGHF
ncbi:MAG TPA: hypothetical protein VNV87_04525 [Acidimicrobiales bacterium]|nr:hypothetical protein [Acidimicrobiales bacterium]